MALTDYQTAVDRLVRDQSGQVTTTDRDAAIASAVQRYSLDAAREVVQDVTWPAAGYYADAPADLLHESSILGAELLPQQVPPATVSVAVMYLPSDGLGLISEQALAAGQVVRVTFTAAHVLAGASDTIPLRHRDAVCSFAAHLLCQQLATYYSGERESAISADGSNTESRARNYAARARDYRAAYYAGLGIADPQGSGTGGGAGGSSAATQNAGQAVSLGQRNRRWWGTNDVPGSGV